MQQKPQKRQMTDESSIGSCDVPTKHPFQQPPQSIICRYCKKPGHIQRNYRSASRLCLVGRSRVHQIGDCPHRRTEIVPMLPAHEEQQSLYKSYCHFRISCKPREEVPSPKDQQEVEEPHAPRSSNHSGRIREEHDYVMEEGRLLIWQPSQQGFHQMQQKVLARVHSVPIHYSLTPRHILKIILEAISSKYIFHFHDLNF